MGIRLQSSNRITAALLVAAVAFCAILIVWTEDSDADAIDSGTIGELFWEFDYYANLTVTGAGEMDFSGCSGVAPWSSHMDDITTIIIGDGVTSIASKAFSGCENLTTITIPDSVETIEEDAFGDLEFYDENGNRLDIDADDLSGSTFTGSENIMVKQDSGGDTDPGSERTLSPIIAIIAGILATALIFFAAVRY